MSKRLLVVSTILLSISLVVLGVMVALDFTELQSELNINNQFSKTHKPNYHLMVIVDGRDQSYVDELNLGLSKAAVDFDVAYEMWDFKSEEREEREEDILRQFDIAIESGVDGIIIQPSADDEFSALLGKSNYRNIPVITLDVDIPSKEKVSYIAYNDYSIGNRLGVLLEEEFNKEKIASGTIVLMQDGDSLTNDLGVGIVEKLSYGFHVVPLQEEYEGDKSLNAEGKTRQVVETYDNLRAIVCSNGEETLGVIETLKELNMLNEVAVVGNDDYDEIMDYIERGTILATVVSDNERVGYEAIRSMTNYNNGLFVSQFQDIQVNIIDKSSIDAYKSEVNDQNEE